MTIEAVRINPKSQCECGHHPFEHDLAHNLLTGEPAKCRKCSCRDMRIAAHSPGPLELE